MPSTTPIPTGTDDDTRGEILITVAPILASFYMRLDEALALYVVRSSLISPNTGYGLWQGELILHAKLTGCDLDRSC
jgi:hypothetical protein